jgi:hypothetical protein
MRPAFRVLALGSILCALFALGQDQPSLGDAARQARQEKQQKGAQAKDGQTKDGQSNDGQSKDSPGKDAQPAKAPKVITNDEIPEHAPASPASADQPRYSQSPAGGAKISPEQWKSQILAQKKMVSSRQREMERLNDSIRFAPANCAANCVQWNQRQREKQQEVERMQAQLEEQKKRLEDMQESARQQGYGSSVYDP